VRLSAPLAGTPGSAPESVREPAWPAASLSTNPGALKTEPSNRDTRRAGDTGNRVRPGGQRHSEQRKSERSLKQLCWFGWRLLHHPGAQPGVFLSGNGARILQPFELLDLVGGAETDDVAKLVARLLRPLTVPLGHPATL
jgi:hypothetical protein